MNKNIIRKALSIVLVLGLISFVPKALMDCNTEALRLVLKSNLKKYKYDSSKVTRYIPRGNKQIYKNSVLLFPKEEYKLMFNTSSSHQDLIIKVYDNPEGQKRKMLYTSEKDPKESGIYTYYPTKKVDKLYIEYEVLGSTNSLECTVFLLGFAY